MIHVKTTARILLLLFIFSILLTPLQYVSAETTEEIDYHELFNSYHGLDGIYASDYFIKMNNIYNTDPDRFITELAKEDYETIVFQAIHLTIEQYYTNHNYTTYHNAIADRLQKLDAESKYSETLTLMLYGSTLYLAWEAPDSLPIDQAVSLAYNENSKLLLLSLSSYRYSDCLSILIDALLDNTDVTQLPQIDTQLAADAEADWATEDTKAVITAIRQRINEVLNPPPTVPEPTVTEPPETTAPPATEPAPTEPTDEKPLVSDDKLVITMIVTLAAILAVGIAWVLIRKKNA